MEEQIAANKRKTIILLGLIFLLFGVVGGVMSFAYRPEVVFGILAVVGLYIIFTYKTALKAVVRLNKAQPATRKDHRRLYLTVENLSITLGIPSPSIYIIPDISLNAFAAGYKPEQSIIGVTQGLLDKLDRQELEGVIAHELSHIINQDVKINTLTFSLVHGMSFLVDISWRTSLIGGSENRSSRNNTAALMLILLVVSIVALILMKLLKLSISRRREYLADASGAQLTKYPEGLRNALKKINSHSSFLRHQQSSTAHLFFVNPLKQSFLDRLMSTHPPLQDRIQKLQQLEEAGL